MAIELINLGFFPNDGTGDDLRTAFQKVNENFSTIDSNAIVNGISLGTGVEVFAGKIDDSTAGDQLTFKTLKEGSNVTLTVSEEEIQISVPDSIPSLNADLNPTLGANLNLNSFTISGNGNININGSITATSITASVFTNINGNVTGNLTGNVTGNLTGNVTGNLTGDTTGLHSGVVIGNVVGNVSGNTTGVHTGNVIGNVTGNTIGIHTGNVIGNVTGNVTGTVNDISNHSVKNLQDVSDSSPIPGQVLIWNGSEYVPGFGAGSDFLTPLLNNFDFGSIEPRNITTTYELLLYCTTIDLGSIDNPSPIMYNAGLF